MRVDIAAPLLGPEVLAAIEPVVGSGRLSGGHLVGEFERAFADFEGLSQAGGGAVATSSGTTALMATLMASGIGRGDEVVLPALTFGATASAICAVGATPVFADIDPTTFCLSPITVAPALTEATAAIIAVDLFGQMAPVAQIAEAAQGRNRIVIEDAAQATGARIGSSGPGTWGVACFSFHGSKALTTGEGGMIAGTDLGLIERARVVCDQGFASSASARDGYGRVHESVGVNFRMAEIPAAIGLAQLPKLADQLARRGEIAARYSTEIREVVTPSVGDGMKHSWLLYTVTCESSEQRDRLLGRIRRAGVDARAYYATPLHQQPAFAQFAPRSGQGLIETERIAATTLSLPVHAGMSDDDVAFVISAVNSTV